MSFSWHLSPEHYMTCQAITCVSCTPQSSGGRVTRTPLPRIANPLGVRRYAAQRLDGDAPAPIILDEGAVLRWRLADQALGRRPQAPM